MRELTREQVERACQDVNFEGNGNELISTAMNQWQYTDASLRASREAARERASILEKQCGLLLQENTSRRLTLGDLVTETQATKRQHDQQLADLTAKLDSVTQQRDQLQATVTAQAEEIKRLREAVKESDDALRAWLHIFAIEECDAGEVDRYKKLIKSHGGTLSYLARVFKLNKDALASNNLAAKED